MKKQRAIVYADDDYEPIGLLIKLRAPTLIIGLFLGIALSFVTSGFEQVLARNVHVAYFLPFVVYIAAATGEQTSSIYARDLGSGDTHFSRYLRKEFLLGIIFGLAFSIFSGALSLFWLKDDLLAISVTVATFLAIATAPLVALLITQAFQVFKEDPAANSGPIATVIQDMISVVIYGVVCSLIIL